jgi:helicase
MKSLTMELKELNIPETVKNLLIRNGFSELYPPQEDAIRTGVLEGRNLVLSSPTASGKTLIAELCAMNHIMEHRGKVVYLTPLRALAWEKYENFQKYSSLEKSRGQNIRIGISTGDTERSSYLPNNDVLITTNEKCDSLLRNRNPWMDQVSLVIADEIHLIGNNRGPTLEVALSRFKQMNPKLQILALSATISNAEEIAEWLNAESVTTEWRPVELMEGVANGDTIFFKDGTEKNLDPLYQQDHVNIALNSVLEGGQVLIFVESRRRALTTARAAASALNGMLSRRMQVKVSKIASEVTSHGEKTRLTDELASAIEKGAAFHHAGLAHNHRQIVEKAFKRGDIKIISATPTLAAGVNLPARTVVIGSYKRFTPGYGMYPIPVLDYKQMSGRAGRPQYDAFGKAILIASSDEEQDYLLKNYILGKPERLYSRLAQESALRSHTLAAISSDYAHTEQGLIEFFGGTFYGFHYPPNSIKLILSSILNYLVREKMIDYKGDFLYPTGFGKRVSELYIDPLTAVFMRDGFTRGALDITDFTWLHLICHTPDMRPILRPRSRDIEQVETYLEEHLEEFSTKIPDHYDYIDYEQFLGEIKTAMVLEAWTNEMSESDLLETFNVQPGDRFSAVHNAQWLLYSAHELAKVLEKNEYRTHLMKMRDRVRYGVTEKLLPLVRLKGIGRVRARVLFNSGFKTINTLKRAPVRSLVELPLIGAGLAKTIKEQVGGVVEANEWKKLSEVSSEQSSLSEFIEEEYEDEIK